MFKFKSKLANLNKLKLYPVSRSNSLLVQINRLNIDSHKNQKRCYKQDYTKKSCRLAILETFNAKKQVILASEHGTRGKKPNLPSRQIMLCVIHNGTGTRKMAFPPPS